MALFVEMRNAAPITHALDGAVLQRLSRNQVAGALGPAGCLRTLAREPLITGVYRHRPARGR